MMNWKTWLNQWEMDSLKINLKFLEMEFIPKTADRDAAWELYVEMITRVTTQTLLPREGDEAAALKSIHSLFGLTRNTIKKHGRECIEFTKIAVVILNQIVRPFTSKWHGILLEGSLDSEETKKQFRQELAPVQKDLRTYARMLSDIAGVEDLTKLEANR